MADKKYIDFPLGTYDDTKIILQADATTGALEKVFLPNLTSLAFSEITGTPTTLAGYGITDAYPLSGNPSGFYSFLGNIGNAIDLNTFTSTGWLLQLLDTQAAAGTNYPAPYAGKLDVFAADGFVYQTYEVYSGVGVSEIKYYRGLYSGTWGSWKTILNNLTGYPLSGNPSGFLTTVPTASASVLGGVKVGSGLTIASGVLSATGGGGSSNIDIVSNTSDITSYSGTKQTLLVQNDLAGGVFNIYTGSDPIDNGIIFQDANSNKWKRQIEDNFVNVAWYGVIGDGTDESTKIQNMFNSLSGVVCIKWNNITYRFYNIQVASTITDLTMEFDGTTFCYPLRNGTPSTNVWYRFFDSVGYQNSMITLTNVAKIFFKGSLLFDGELRLGNSFNVLNSTGGPYSGEGLAQMILITANQLSVNNYPTTTLTPASGSSLIGSTGINLSTTSATYCGYIQFTNRPGYQTLIRYTLNTTSGTIGTMWNTATIVSYTPTQGDNVIYVPATEGYKFQTYKIFAESATAATLTNISVQEIAQDHLDTYVKTEGFFQIIDHGFSALGISTDNTPAYKVVDIQDWHWYKTVFGGMRIQGNNNTVNLSHFSAYDIEARSHEQDIFGGDSSRGISVDAANSSDTSTYPMVVHYNDFDMDYHQGYTIAYAFKKLIWENMTYRNWGRYVSPDGITRDLAATTGSVYDLPIATGGPAIKIDPTYWNENYLVVFRNINFINTSTLIKNNGKYHYCLWLQTAVKNIHIEDSKFDGFINPQGTGDYDPTTESWSYRPTFKNCEFTEESSINTDLGCTFIDCKWTRLRVMKGSSIIVDYPYPTYEDLKECVALGSSYNYDSLDFGNGDFFDYNNFTRCFFTARNFNQQIQLTTAVFRDCVFDNGSCIPLYGSVATGVPVAYSFNFKFYQTKRVTINYVITADSTYRGVNKVYFEDSEIIISNYLGNTADLENASTNIRKILDSSAWSWNNLKVYSTNGTLLHDLKGFEWFYEPPSVSSYGLDGAYYETLTKRYDYFSGNGSATATITGSVGQVVIGTDSTNGFGTAYTSAPTVVFTGGGGTGATATATINPYSFISISVTNPGTGYTSIPTVTITGGGGTGATATAVLLNGVVSMINMTATGTGYTSAPTITITGGGGSGAVATPNFIGGSIASIAITNAGSGYTTPPTVSLTGGGGSGAVLTAFLGSCTVTGITVTNPGSYATAPSVYFLGGNNKTVVATATATLSGTGIASFTITNAGAGYSSVPNVILYGGSQWTIKNKTSVYTTNISFGAGNTVGAYTYLEISLSLTGSSIGDIVTIGYPATVNPELVFIAFVATANTVTLRAMNTTASVVTVTSDNFQTTIIK